MVDPTNDTDYHRTDAELEEFLLFSISVAGKTASQIAIALERFFNFADQIIMQQAKTNNVKALMAEKNKYNTPFKAIKRLIEIEELENTIKISSLGQHGKLKKAFTELATVNFDLKTCSIDELETITGIGPKTSRFFILHTRPKQKIAVLDTHILKYIRQYVPNAPKATPSKKRYNELEQWFIKHCATLKVDIAEYDLLIWNRYARK